MNIIPAIDIIEGKCVRLTKGDYSTKKIYSYNPLDMAKKFEDNGLKYLHLVDLDGAKSNHIVNHRILNKIATKTKLHIDFGGGIKSTIDLNIAFENGAKQVTAGSIAAQNPELFLSWLDTYGSDKIILGADSHNRNISTNGWQQEIKADVLEYISNYAKKGVQHVICTDISKDGMLQGPSTDLYKEILEKTGVKLIASGGVSSIDDLHMLQQIGCSGVIIGKAIYEKKISLEQLRQFIWKEKK